MSTIAANYKHAEDVSAVAAKSAASRVVSILRLTFGLVPIIAGADKFTDIMVNWDQYLSPAMANVLPFSAHAFMIIVGIIEIVAGLIVLLRPRTGSLIVALWLIAIALNLLFTGRYLDVAVRDIVMSTGAYSLFLLTQKKN